MLFKSDIFICIFEFHSHFAFVWNSGQTVVNEVFQNLYRFCVLAYNWELKSDSVKMLSYLWTSCCFGQSLVILDDCLIMNDINWMWIPSVYVFGNEFVEYSFQAPMAHKILFQLNLDIRGACHNHHWFEPSSRINMIDRLLFDTITWSTFNSSLQTCLRSWVMQSTISNRLPLQFFIIIRQQISRELIHKDMEPLGKRIKHVRLNSFLNSCKWPTFFTSIYNRNMFWLHSTIVCHLC